VCLCHLKSIVIHLSGTCLHYVRHSHHHLSCLPQSRQVSSDTSGQPCSLHHHPCCCCECSPQCLCSVAREYNTLHWDLPAPPSMHQSYPPVRPSTYHSTTLHAPAHYCSLLQSPVCHCQPLCLLVTSCDCEYCLPL
jgi:hypothetical protein